jgi:ABC-type transporter Mla subunit MlaD
LPGNSQTGDGRLHILGLFFASYLRFSNLTRKDVDDMQTNISHLTSQCEQLSRQVVSHSYQFAQSFQQIAQTEEQNARELERLAQRERQTAQTIQQLIRQQESTVQQLQQIQQLCNQIAQGAYTQVGQQPQFGQFSYNQQQFAPSSAGQSYIGAIAQSAMGQSGQGQSNFHLSSNQNSSNPSYIGPIAQSVMGQSASQASHAGNYGQSVFGQSIQPQLS